MWPATLPLSIVHAGAGLATPVNAVIFYQVIHAHRAITFVSNYASATSQIAQTTLGAMLLDIGTCKVVSC